MTDATIRSSVTGGQVQGVVGAGTVVIENFTIYNRSLAESAKRLHSVVTKPYDSESNRTHRAIAIGKLVIDVLARTGEDADHPAAKVRVGIDTGKALAVNNGRRGHRDVMI